MSWCTGLKKNYTHKNLTQMAYYFCKTVAEGSRNRLRALPKQSFPDGTPIDTTLNIQADKIIRSQYPIGTVFVTENLRVDDSRAVTFYSAERIYPVSSESDFLYADESHRPTESMQNAYLAFLGLADVDFVEPEEPVAESPKKERKKRKSLLEKLMSSEDFRTPTIKDDGFFVSEENWFLLIRNILNQVNTMIVGPTGTGKTEIVMLACRKLGIDCFVYDMGSMYDPVAGLLGVHRLQRGGVSVFDYAKFTQDIQKPCVILLDELSRAPVTTNNILFPCLDSRRTLPVEIAGGEDVRSIKVHPECTFIATANVGAEYTGTMSMDRALVNRFFPMELGYMPENNEVEVLAKRCHIEVGDARKIVGVTNTIRSLYRKQELSVSLSTRETLVAAGLVADGWSPLTAMELVFLPLFEGTRSDGERGMVVKTLMSK